MDTQKQNAPEITAGPRLRFRHAKAKIFAGVCAAATWVGVVMLVVLLTDVVLDSTGWIYSRVDRDPRMIMHKLQTDPQFVAQVEDKKPSILTGMERKANAKQRRLAKNGIELTEAELDSFRLDYLHNQVSKDSEAFAELETDPTLQERWAIGGTIIQDIIAAFPSRFPSKAGLKSALAGSLWLILFTALFAIPIGVSAAVYLEEYAPKNRLSRFIEVNIANLAGVPSIVYGILGLVVFVRGIQLGRSVLAGALTMCLLILPVIIIAAREAIKAVPDSIRQGAFALGATRWQTVRHHVLPVALPGILTGVILAMSRALGETAPMIMIGALSYVAFVPAGPMDDFTVLPIQIYNWVAMPQQEFHLLAACGIFVLLIFLLLMNSVAIFMRQRAQRNVKW